MKSNKIDFFFSYKDSRKIKREKFEMVSFLYNYLDELCGTEPIICVCVCIIM